MLRAAQRSQAERRVRGGIGLAEQAAALAAGQQLLPAESEEEEDPRFRFVSYRDRPVPFAREVLGRDPWGKQIEIMDALYEWKRVSVVTANGVGKTELAAFLILNFLYSRPGAVVVTTSTTKHQLVNVLWRRIRKLSAGAKKKLIGRMLTDRLEITEDWFALGISSDDETAFQGQHVLNEEAGILVVIDEASGVQNFVFDAIRGYLTSENAYVLLLGNGNKATGEFWESHQRGNWKRFSISAMEAPRHIIPQSWIEEMRDRYGEDSPQWAVRVMGKFPTQGVEWQLVDHWMLEQCEDIVTDNTDGVHVGIDLSRGNRDMCVATRLKNLRVVDQVHWQAADTMRSVDYILRIVKEWNPEVGHLHIDSGGIGGPVIDRLRQLGLTVDAVDFSIPNGLGDWRHIHGDTKFANRKAELYWTARMLLQHQKLCIPRKFKDLWEELQLITYEPDTGLRMAIAMESKKNYAKKNAGESPDFADSLFIALARAASRPKIFFV